MQKKSEKTEITGNLDPKYWVQKSDPLVLMRSVPFSLGELKILDTYISRINAADDTRRTVVFTKEDYEKLMGVPNVDYRTLKRHTRSMLGKVVELEMPNKEYLQFVLFEQARYRKDEYGKPIVELTCTTMAKDLFFCMGKYHYFKYALENVVNLTRKSSYLLYLYIRSNRYRGAWEIGIDELRDSVFDCAEQESYRAFKEFKRAVLEPAVKEVNAKTDCSFSYEPVKRGRKVAKIKFIYKSQDKIDGQMSLLDESTVNSNAEITDENAAEIYGSESLAFIAGACDYEFNRKEMRVIFDIVAKHSNNDLERYNYLRHKYNILQQYATKTQIKHRYNYLLKLLNDDTE